MRRHLEVIATSVFSAAFGVACAASSSAPPAPRPNLPIAESATLDAGTVHETPTLPPVLSARIGAAMKAVSLFAPEFEGLSSMRPCVLVFEPKREWIFQCPGLAKHPAFEDTHASFGDAPVFSAPTFTLPGQTVDFEKVKMIVGRAGGNIRLADERGEPRPTPFFLVQDLDSLHAHHPAFTDTSAEDWTAVFVHEYFHVLQFAQPEVAELLANGWPKDWPQREVHAKFFDDTPAYKEAILSEVALLQNGLAVPSKAGSKAVLTKWLAARDRRVKKFGDAFQKATGKGGFEQTDGFFTFLEGTARYLEVRFLCERSLVRPDMSGDPSFRKFDAFEGCGPTKVEGRDRTSGAFHYQLGALVSAHLDAANPGWKKTIFTRPGFLVEEARQSASR